MNSFVLVVGPTAAGKSALGLALAETYGGTILNCDSVQACQRLDVGAAKPTAAERARVPHVLFDVITPGNVLTAGDFRHLALAALETSLPRGPVFGVGGSGFYIQALEKGMFDVPKADPELDQRVRARVADDGLPRAYAELLRRDPEYAARVSPNDAYRVTRALVIMASTSRTVSELKRSFTPTPFPYPLVKLGLTLERDQLLARVRARTAAMLESGLVGEVEALLAEGFSEWPPLDSVGYREVKQMLAGKVTMAELPELITQKTMALAKKQRTWFKRDPEITWVNADHAVEDARRILDQSRLKS